MDLDRFIKNFAAQFDEMNANEFQTGTKFRDLEGWSSLSALSIIAMIDEEYGVSIKGGDIRKAETIEDLFKTVLERKQ
ncbi:MAG: acyl carrier protein [Bacteroidales bacterium]|jgi:acyl carrier protein|nr:acyl carrier protein [Bacteroidales bacterium]